MIIIELHSTRNTRDPLREQVTFKYGWRSVKPLELICCSRFGGPCDHGRLWRWYCSAIITLIDFQADRDLQELLMFEMLSPHCPPSSHTKTPNHRTLLFQRIL